MQVILPDKSALELPDGASGLDAARAIGPKLAEQAVLVRADGVARDLRLPLADGEAIEIVTTRDRDDADALYVLRHSAAHLLAEAVRRLYPGVKVAIGPPIENGFYYDFEFPEPIHEADLERIEEEVQRELAEGRAWSREEISRDAARERFNAEGEQYKVELVDTAEGDISLYTQGDFTDLCRGPHLQDSKPIKALKLTGLAGAYWRGDERNAQLTRIYGTAFYAQDDLDAYLEQIEEAKRRDHRRIGAAARPLPPRRQRAGDAVLAPEGDGALERARGSPPPRERSPRLRRGEDAAHVRRRDVWITSGHWEKFRDNMFLLPYGEARTFGLKPMNCPGHMLLFGSALRSYRDLPIRYAESSTLHRNERAGTLHGLLRVQHVTQDDAHIFCTEEQIEDEVFRLSRLRRSTSTSCSGWRRASSCRHGPRPSSAPTSSGITPRARSRRALERREIPYVVSEGEGAFYGPKIDLHMTDVLGRAWQMGTIQLDYQMPARFGLTYIGADNAEHTPYVIHRALLGSLERFLGILVEHYGGAFPLWLAPVQVRVIPVGEDHRAAAAGLRERLEQAGVRVDVDERDETVSKRIRDAELEKIPRVVVYGDKESDDALAVRERGGGQSTRSLDELIGELATL